METDMDLTQGVCVEVKVSCLVVGACDVHHDVHLDKTGLETASNGSTTKAGILRNALHTAP